MESKFSAVFIIDLKDYKRGNLMFQKLFSQSLVVVAILSLVFSQMALYPELKSQRAYALSGEEDHYDRDVEELRGAFLEGRSSHLDPFQLAHQAVVDERSSNLKAVQDYAQLEDYLDRERFYRSEIEELNRLKEKAVAEQKRTNELVAGRPSQEKTAQEARWKLVLADLESRIKIAELQLKDVQKFDPRKGKGLEVEFMIDTALRTRHYWRNELQIQLNTTGGEVVVNQKDFTESLSSRFQRFNPMGSNHVADGGFTIADHKGRALHKFSKPVEAVFFYGPYLVYVEKGGYDSSTKTQNVRFIDLQYFKSSIGNGPLPVYTFPVQLASAPDRYSIQEGLLQVGDVRLNFGQFAMLAKTHQMIFNVSAALVDSTTYRNAAPLIEEISEFFTASMRTQERIFQTSMEKVFDSRRFISGAQNSLQAGTEGIDIDTAREVIAKARGKNDLTGPEFDQIKGALDIRDHTKNANQAVFEGRKFVNRLNLLWRNLMQPRPEGAPKILNGLMTVGFRETLESRVGFKRLGKYGPLVATGVAANILFLPESHSLHIYQSLDLISSIYEHFMGYLKHSDYGRNYAILSKDAFITSVTGWYHVPGAYFPNIDSTGKFLYGLGQVLLVPLKLFALIHFTMNTRSLFSKTREVYRSTSKGVISSFIEAEKQLREGYWEVRAEAEREASAKAGDGERLSAEELKLLEDLLTRLKEGRADTAEVEKSIKRVLRGKSPYKQRSWVGLLDSVGRVKDMFSFNASFKIEGNAFGALINAFTSYASLQTTFRTNANIWNYLFITRSFAWSPPKWLMLLIYPNYFNVAAAKTQGKQHFPSRYNGGLDSWPSRIARVASRVGLSRVAEKFESTRNIFMTRSALQNLGEFENSVGVFEQAAMEISLKKAQKALIQRITDPERLLVLFDSGQRQGIASTGVSSLYDAKISKLSSDERIFFRSYFTRTFDTLMQHFVARLSNVDFSTSMDPETFAREFVKELKRGSEITFPTEVSKTEISRMEAEVESAIDFEEIRQWSEKTSSSITRFGKRLTLKFRHVLLKGLHPKNPQINRFLTSKEKVQDPAAMDRAVRAEIATYATSLPIGIVSTLALYAGVQTGLLMPFDPSGLDTETHFRYMSRYLFYNGFIPGLIIGLMANTWMKVQLDNRIASEGGFERQIAFKDSKRGFWRYWVKNFWKNPENRWSKNQIFNLKLITANIPAAAVTIIVSQLYGLGRIDPGAVLAGYIIIYTTFLTGFNLKMDQAFELASSWMKDKIPRRLRANANAQKYIGQSIQKRRFSATMIEEFWAIVVNENIAGSMVALKDNTIIGTRAFLRLIFGGDTPAELLVSLINKLQLALVSVPYAEGAFEWMRNLISHNYEAFERFPERLGPGPELTERVVEMSGLPENRLAEGLGKAAGAGLTIATVAATPYVASKVADRIREGRIQRQGIRVRQTNKIFEQGLRCNSFL